MDICHLAFDNNIILAVLVRVDVRWIACGRGGHGGDFLRLCAVAPIDSDGARYGIDGQDDAFGVEALRRIYAEHEVSGVEGDGCLHDKDGLQYSAFVRFEIDQAAAGRGGVGSLCLDLECLCACGVGAA